MEVILHRVNNLLKKLFFTLVCSILSYQYVKIISDLPESYWLHYTEKPFVYRSLIPTLGQGKEGILLITFIFSVLLAITMLYLYYKYWTPSLKNDVVFILSFSVITLILTRYSNYYDFASAFFFLVLLLLWMEKKYILAIPVFALATLNKETAILIIPVLFFIKKHWSIVANAVAYVIIRIFLLWVFSDASGSALYIQPMNNIILHAINYWQTLILVLGAWVIFLMSLKVRKEFLAFMVVLFPALAGVYLVCGYAFEIRVFGEVLPLLFMSAFMTIDN